MTPEPLPEEDSRFVRGLWVAAGLALLAAACLLGSDPRGIANAMIPAGAWMVMRGLL